MPDNGPIYTETILALQQSVRPWIMEPWNAGSAILFIILSIFWTIRLVLSSNKDAFLLFTVSLLFIGGVGGTLYHSFRSQRIYLLMDWMPIAILCASFVFWLSDQLISKKPLAILSPIAGFACIMLTFTIFRKLGLPSRGPSIGYLMLAAYVLIPLFLYLKKINYQGSRLVLLAVCSFALAYLARTVDRFEFLPMGTHFLWHLFGALATHLLISFVWKMSKQKPKSFSSEPGSF